MDDDRQNPEGYVQLTDAQIQVLRKHLARRSLSLDDAAVLVGVPVDDLAQHFEGRRASQEQDDQPRESGRRRSRSSAYDPDERDAPDDGDSGLRAPARTRSRRRGESSGGGRTWLWTGGALAAVAVIGVLALLSGVPQSLLFPPRGVGEHKDANAIDTSTPVAPAEAQPAEAPPETLEAEASPPQAVDPMTAEAPPEAVADPALDPAAVPPAGTEPAELPVPAAPEEVAPAVAVAEAETPSMPMPAAPSFAAPDAAPAPAPAASVGPSATLYAARAATVRDNPTASGSAVVAQLKRGESVSGAIVAGADGKSSWLHIESGPGAGGYVSVANMAETPRPAVIQAIGQPRTLVQSAALHASPDETSPALDTLSPGISVLAAAEVDGGWIEINRRAGGVGYIRREAFQ
jgi:hypothetical protein